MACLGDSLKRTNVFIFFQVWMRRQREQMSWEDQHQIHHSKSRERYKGEEKCILAATVDTPAPPPPPLQHQPGKSTEEKGAEAADQCLTNSPQTNESSVLTSLFSGRVTLRMVSAEFQSSQGNPASVIHLLVICSFLSPGLASFSSSSCPHFSYYSFLTLLPN